jgi:hypothetical protein
MFGTALIGMVLQARPQRLARVTEARSFAPRCAGVVEQIRSRLFEQSGTQFRHALANIDPASP